VPTPTAIITVTEQSRPAPVVLAAPVALPATGGDASSHGNSIPWLAVAFLAAGTVLAGGTLAVCRAERHS
jgi:hypothetical protein